MRIADWANEARLAVSRYPERLDEMADSLPSGSGYDGAQIDGVDGGAVVVSLSYHHMDHNGMYCGWSSHVVRIGPDTDTTGEPAMSIESDYDGVDWTPDYDDDEAMAVVDLELDAEPTDAQIEQIQDLQRPGNEEYSSTAVLDDVAEAIRAA